MSEQLDDGDWGLNNRDWGLVPSPQSLRYEYITDVFPDCPG